MGESAEGGEEVNSGRTKKTPRPAGGTARRAKVGVNHANGYSHDQNTTDRSDGQAGTISGLLLHGAENGLHLRDLSQIVGADPRIVRQMIHNERRQGTPILSNSKDGYYLPACEDEKEACVRQMRSRAREILAAAAGIERGGR